jgi:hypothetical protein
MSARGYNFHLCARAADVDPALVARLSAKHGTCELCQEPIVYDATIARLAAELKLTTPDERLVKICEVCFARMAEADAKGTAET